jgi:nucleotide-binding universal stress UspA family protein
LKARRILHPTDFSRASRAAFARAPAGARAERAELLIVHVLPAVIPLVGDGYVSPSTYADMEASMRIYGQKQLDKFVGSVAERVIGTAPCPVPTVHGK